MKRQKASFWQQNKAGLIILAVSLLVMCGISCLMFFLLGRSGPTPTTDEPASRPLGELVLAYSSEKNDLLPALIDEFNSAGYRTSNGERMRLTAEVVDPDQMIRGAMEGRYHIVSPDSSIWLDSIDRAWSEETGVDAPLVGQTFRYAVSPLVIAMWEDVARSLGYPERSLGWSTILEKAGQDSSFRWSHPSTGTAAGLLATLAQFYAAAGKTRNLTEEDALAEPVLSYVSAIQKTVSYYGEGESALIERALKSDTRFLDAFVVQEQKVIYYNTHGAGRLIAIYPQEGTLWEDHPMALLELPGLSVAQRQVFSRWQEFLSSEDVQRRILGLGYRPADMSISLDYPGSPFSAGMGVDPRQPQTALQVPSPAVIEVVKNVWWYTKRRTNLILVVDVSGSMRGRKMNAAQEALEAFLGQIVSDDEAVGLITFSSYADESVPLSPLSANRSELQEAISDLHAGGETALIDAVDLAHSRLQALGDRERINAVVVMTDGLENRSQMSLGTLERRLQEGKGSGVPVLIFCIAFGDDADYRTLNRIADATGGQVREGTPETIRELYKILSTYF